MPTKQKFLVALVVLLLSAVSFIWLTSHLFSRYPWYGQYQQRDPDSLLFTRLLEQSILMGKVVETDSYGCYPYEIEHGFAPFYLYFLLNLTGAFFTLFPGCEFEPLYVAGSLPIIFALLTGLMILFTLLKVSKKPGLVLFCAFCMLPGLELALSATFMKLDYDFLVSFYIWGWICSCILFLETGNRGLKIIAGIVAALFLATWSGTPLFFFFVTVFGFILWFSRQNEAPRYLEFASSGMLIGSMLNLAFIITSYRDPFLPALTKYSIFQPGCLLLGGIFLYFINSLYKYESPRKIALAVLGAMTLGLGFVFKETLMQATGILFQADPIHKTISELMPIIDFSKLASNSRTIARFTEYLNWPAVFLFFLVFTSPRGLPPASGRMLRFWLFIMVVLSVRQVRYLRWIGAGGGLLSGMIVYSLFLMVRKYLQKAGMKNARLVLIFLPLLVLYSLQNFSFQITDANLSDPQIEAYNWIARNTPETSGYFDEKRPEYSILTYWDEGNLLSYYARRPVAVNNAMWGYKTMADIFSSSDENEAFNLCDEYGVRYIFLSTYRQFDEQSYSFWPYFKSQPKKPEYTMIYEDIPRSSKDQYKNWFYFWLLDHLGLTPKGKFPASSRFRLVYAAKAKDEELAPYILFERVPGARLEMSAAPGTRVSISLELQVGGQHFGYKVHETADDSGTVRFLLPYSNDYSSGRVKTSDIYKIGYEENADKKFYSLKVSESCVKEGKLLPASALQQVQLQ